MKTVFIINPKAGKKKNIDALVSSIKNTAQSIRTEIEIYVTKAVGDAQRFVKDYCENSGAARFIACGGDGTLNEVLNGAIECDMAQIGVMPMGTGNDFCRNFDCPDNFSDIEAQIQGDSIKCDAIYYNTEIDSSKKSGYAVNMFNIGFDCNVADLTQSIKKSRFIYGSFAYFASIIVNLIKKKGANLKIEIDDKIMHDGKLLLTSVANGCFCGGGIKSNPLAQISDGKININIIKNVSRARFLTLLPYYMKGTFLNLSNIEKIITSQKCEKVVITPYEKPLRISSDGEITDVGKIEFLIKHDAFNFVVPSKKSVYNMKEKTPQAVF